MRKTIKKMLPDVFVLKIRQVLNKLRLYRLYSFDKKRYEQAAYNLNNNWSLNNLRSKITLHYHSIEKGLSNPNIRLGFGKNAFNGLFFSMDTFIEKGYPIEDDRFQQGITVIQAYIRYHKENNFSVEPIESKLKEYLPYDLNIEATGGYNVIYKVDLKDYKEMNFEELATFRYSIRDFGPELIDDIEINNAIQIATKTPSVCNRQAHKVYRIKDEKILKIVHQMQGGLTTHGENLNEILLITSNREFMSGPHERNQTYIDGGMFLMSLVYGLTYNNIASCVLNANFMIDKEKAMRSLLNISYAEDLIAFVAIGSFKDENKIAKSPRDKYNKITKII